MSDYEILNWDSNFFGFKVAKIFIQELNKIDSIIEDLKEKNIKLVYWQVRPEMLGANEIAKKHGGVMVDLKTTFSTTLNKKDHYSTDKHIQLYEKNFACDDIMELAVQCGLYSRYFIDKRIPRDKATALYKIWIQKSVNHEMADDVLVYKANKHLAGLVSVGIKNDIGHIGLVGVDATHRGNSIGSKLIFASLDYFANRGVKTVNVITQGYNLPACNFYKKCGFEVSEQVNFYHFWLD